MAARTEYEIGSKRGGGQFGESSNTDGTREKKANTEEAEAVTPKGHRKMLSAAATGRHVAWIHGRH